MHIHLVEKALERKVRLGKGRESEQKQSWHGGASPGQAYPPAHLNAWLHTWEIMLSLFSPFIAKNLMQNQIHQMHSPLMGWAMVSFSDM